MGNDDQQGEENGSEHEAEDASGDVKRPVTRRAFVAGAGVAAAAIVAKPAKAFAAGNDPIYRIHPAIGVARMGNADADQFFIGPEVPGYAPSGEAPGTVVPPYKAPDGRIKPQGARFRIFEYAYVNGRLQPVREVNLSTPGVVAITWNVHLANKKAAFHGFEGRQGEVSEPAPLRNAAVTDRRSLEIDFGPRAIQGASQGPKKFVPDGSTPDQSCPLDYQGQPVIDYLGELRTDAQGRLIVIGGKGRSNFNTATQPAMPHWANNDGWFDDASDGPVTAIVTIDDNGTQRNVPIDARGGAWVLCGPPDFAPGIPASVTGYDLMLDLAVRSIAIPAENGLYDAGQPLEKVRTLKADYVAGADYEFPTAVPSFTEDIEPILVAAYNLWYVNGLVTAKHNSLLNPNLGSTSAQYKAARQKVLSYMRPPVGVNMATGTRTMPKLLGDDPYIGSLPESVRRLPLSHLQFGLLRRWADGNFTPATGAPPPAPVITAHGLDRAALENCSGGAFFPGIEFGWQLRNPSLFIEPFRLNLNATSGYLGEQGVLIEPGHFSRQMAVPWQADFNDCRNEGNYGWWPSQRPTDALPSATSKTRVPWARATNRFEGGNRESTHEDMVKHWYKFGFVVEAGELYVEQERAPQIP